MGNQRDGTAANHEHGAAKMTTKTAITSNSLMVGGRFASWATYRKRLSDIHTHLSAGGRIVVATYTRATVYTAKHADLFRATKSGLYVTRGKSRDCLNFTTIKFVA
jgi:hypothetical protein